MKKILFPLVLVFVCFMINTFAGFVASLAFLIWAFLHFLPNFYALRGNKQYADGNLSSAIKLYKKAVKSKKATDKIRLSYGIMLLRSGYPEDAESIFDKVAVSKTASQAEKLSAKQFRAMAYCKQNRMKEAMEDARELYETYKSSTTYSLLGYFKHLIKTPPKELLAFCEEGYDFNSDERDIADNYMLALYKNGEYEKAREIGEKIIEKNPKFVEGYYHSAMCEVALGRKKEARELLENIPNCKRTYLTTVSEEEVDSLRKEVENA